MRSRRSGVAGVGKQEAGPARGSEGGGGASGEHPAAAENMVCPVLQQVLTEKGVRTTQERRGVA